MSTKTDIISTTDLRLWVEELHADHQDEICEAFFLNNQQPCPKQAVARVILSCCCRPRVFCYEHKEKALAVNIKSSDWVCTLCGQLGYIIRWEPISH